MEADLPPRSPPLQRGICRTWHEDRFSPGAGSRVASGTVGRLCGMTRYAWDDQWLRLLRDSGLDCSGPLLSIPVKICACWPGFTRLAWLQAGCGQVGGNQIAGADFAADLRQGGASAPSPRLRDDSGSFRKLIFPSLLVQVRLRLSLRDVRARRGGAIPRCLMPSITWQHFTSILS